MPDNRLRTAGCVLAALCLAAACGATAVAEEQAGPTAGKTVDRSSVQQPPEKPLDERVSAEKVTEYDPPPLPEQVIVPLPPVHRVAAERSRVPVSEAHWEKAKAAIGKGIAYLKGTQDEYGGWMTEAMASPTDKPAEPSPVAAAVTAMAVRAIVQAEPGAQDDPAVRKAVRFIELTKKPDGSFHGGALGNYVTSIVVAAMSVFDGVELKDHVDEGVKWLKDRQWDQGEGLSIRQDWFGGAGYGDRGRPDMSNTQMMLDALYEAGVSPDDPAFQRALAFVSRAQNLKATNKASWAGNDGGFIYSPANGGESFGSQAAGEGRHGEEAPEGEARSLRSYGSMTYAGFKSMIYAGLRPDDIRVRAAFDWIRRHFIFDENPGVGRQGLYYYYYTMSRALRVAQQDTITDTAGTRHNWREALIDAITQRQGEDGSWKNEADRWLESEPALATAYSLLALEEALKPAPGGG